MRYKNYQLDKFQIEAIRAIDAHKTVIVAAPTGAGKTVIAEYVVENGLQRGKRIIYTAPIKALSNQKYRDFSAEHSGKIGIVTGDVSINSTAPVLVMTTEIFRNTIFGDPDSLLQVDYVIFDEVHYINDIERGTVWEESIIFAPQEIEMLCLSATIPNLSELADWIGSVRNRDVAVIEETERPVPLEHAIFMDNFGIGTIEDVERIKIATLEQQRALLNEKSLDLIEILRQEGKLPCLYFCQSRKRTEEMAFENTERELLTEAESREILSLYDLLCLQHHVAKSPLPPFDKGGKGATVLREMVKHGVAYHHAGMLPALKDVVERLFATGLIRLIFTTETFAVGVNMPACSVVFDSLEKFDGARNRYLKAREYLQMSGRAGRRGMDDVGYVYAKVNPLEVDFNVISKIVSGEIESIDSQFDLSY
ncbi:MAG: DEAD/DEAH box helicase, partial [Candidatus Poribacteria bacterium]